MKAPLGLIGKLGLVAAASIGVWRATPSNAATLQGLGPRGDIRLNRVEPEKSVVGMRMIFEVEGLDLLDNVWSNRQNPEPPHFCQTPAKNGANWEVWINDPDGKYGRTTEEVAFLVDGSGQTASLGMPLAAGSAPKGCDAGRLFGIKGEENKSLRSVSARDIAGHTTLIPPAGTWPPTFEVPLLEDEASPDAETSPNFDILWVSAATDADWLYLSMKVRGKVATGTTSPMDAHLYGFALLDSKLGDKVQGDTVTGLMAHYMYHYKIANQKQSVLIRLRNDKTKLSDEDIEADAQAGVVHFKLKKKTIGLKPGNPIKVIGFTAQVPQLGPYTKLRIKDVTATGQIQVF